VTCKLSIVVTYYAHHESGTKLKPGRPLEMEFVTALVVGSRVLEIERQARGAIELQLACLVGPGDRPAHVYAGAVQSDIRGKAWIPSAGWGYDLQIHRMG